MGALWAVVSSAQMPNAGENPPPDIQSFSDLLTAVAAGYNHYCMVPLQFGVSDIQVDNLAHYQNHVLVIGELPDGSFEQRLERISVQGSAILTAVEIEVYDRLFLISMQSFHVQSSQALHLLGLKTRHLTTVAPTRPLDLLPVRGPDGEDMILGKTPDGTVFYPVFGYKYGVFDENRGIVIQEGEAVRERPR